MIDSDYHIPILKPIKEENKLIIENIKAIIVVQLKEVHRANHLPLGKKGRIYKIDFQLILIKELN